MAQSNMVQKVCYDRCSDTLQGHDLTLASHDSLPESTRRCIDVCFNKFAGTAQAVSYHSQVWQAREQRQQAVQSLATRVMCGLGVVVVGVGACTLCRGGSDA